jgi:putative hemolysin
MDWLDFFWGHAWQLLVLPFLLIGSGFFSGTETAMFNLTRGQLYRMRQNQGRLGHLVVTLMRRPQRLLNTLLLGNMIVNVAYTALTAVIILDLHREGVAAWVVGVAPFVPLTVLILLGEVTPKMLAYRLSARWSVLASAPIAVVDKALAPVVWLVHNGLIVPVSRLIAPRHVGESDITGEELAALVDLSARRGLIDRDANALLREIVELTDIRVSEVMVPRVDIVAYDVNDPPEGLSDLFRETRLRKIPVFDRDIDNLLGVVYARQLLFGNSQPLRERILPVPFVPEAANIERALLQLRVSGQQTAFVVDEYGGIAGLVTLEDITEEIVGNIEESQEAIRDEPVRRVGRNEYLLDGDLAIHEWADAFQIDLQGERISTIGGFVMSLLGRIPSVGDVASYRNLEFRVEAMRGRRISTIRLRLKEAQP